MADFYKFKITIWEPSKSVPKTMYLTAAHRADTQEQVDSILDFAKQNLRYMEHWSDKRIEGSNLSLEGPIDSSGQMRPC